MQSLFVASTVAASETTLMAETALSLRFGCWLPRVLTAAFCATAMPAYADTFNVSTASQLYSAINNASNGDVINLTANITLSYNLPVVTKNLTINGGAHTLSGDGQYRGLFVQSGTVNITNMTIANTVAQGGKGGDGWGGGGGGGGAGMGGALFVGNGAHVTVSDLNFQKNSAKGGNGGVSTGDTAPGWILPVASTSGGGGGHAPIGADGGNANGLASGGGGAGNGGDGYDGSAGAAGGLGGGGGGSGYQSGGIGGLGGGGGGSSASSRTYSPGGFLGGAGGYGATGWMNNGDDDFAGSGGGGAGMGGAIFVEEGGALELGGALTVSGGSVFGGAGGAATAGPVTPGQSGGAAGTGMFLAGNGTLTFVPAGGDTQVISDVITDQTGSGGTGSHAGSWSLVKNAQGTLVLAGKNTYSGGTTVNSGVLQGTTDSIQGNILNNAKLAFDQGGNGTYSGAISGTGTVTKSGSGTVVLSGTNSYSGGTTVTGGLLLATSDAAYGVAGAGITLNGGGVGAVSSSQTFNRALTLVHSGTLHNGEGNLTWSGAISGSGQLVVSGEGTVNLTGTNTHTGGTLVTGNLSFTSDTNLGASGTAITLAGGSVTSTNDATPALSIIRAITLTEQGTIGVGRNPLVWSGNISGTGVLIKNGPGVLQLLGTNTYSGGTSVAGGTLQVASDDKLGSDGTPIRLTNGGHLWATQSFTTTRHIYLGVGGFQVDSGNVLTLAGGISGGALSLVGAGTLVLAGPSSYDGIMNFGGDIQGNVATLKGDIQFDQNSGNTNARSVTFEQMTDGTFGGNITGIGGTAVGLGSIIKSGAGKLVLTGESHFAAQGASGATFVIAEGTLQGTSRNLVGAISNDAALIFDQSFNGTFGGSITGSGTLTKAGTGSLTFTGVSTVAGGTTIDAGVLAVNGHLNSNVTVNKGGTLRGSGHVTGDLINNGGDIQPGNSIGHLTVNGNFTFNSGTYAVEVNAAGDSDRISVVGAGHRVEINAGTLLVLPEPGIYTPGTRYTIITTDGGGSVHFDTIAGGTAFLKPQVSIDPNDIYVTLALLPGAFRAQAVTQNERAVGSALDVIAGMGGSVLSDTLASVPLGSGAAALQQLTGQPYADVATVNIRASQLFMNTVGRQMAVDRGAGFGGTASIALDAPGLDGRSRFTGWVSGIGTKGGLDGNANAADLSYSLGGTAFGISYRLDPRLQIGIAGAFVGGSQSVGGFLGKGEIEVGSIAIQGSLAQGPVYVDALFGYAHSSTDMERILAVPGVAGIANGTVSSNQLLGQIEGGYRFAIDGSLGSAITPFGRLQLVSYDQAAFTESGFSLYNLSVRGQSLTSVRTTLGADFATRLNVGGTPLELAFRLGWVHEFGDTARPMTAAFAVGPLAQFTVFGAPEQRDSALIGLGAEAQILPHAAVFASYDAELNGGSDSHQLWGGIRFNW
ncbi:autotransporter domain-containing protein [Xanthobacteraceae bacterium A53D]